MRNSEERDRGSNVIETRIPSKFDPVTQEQVEHLGHLLRALRKRAVTHAGRGRPIDWNEWVCFLTGAYACGFVNHDGEGSEGAALYETLQVTPDAAKRMSVYDLKCLIHYIVRSERWGDGGGDFGASTLWPFVTSRGGEKVAERLGTIANDPRH